MNPSPKWVFVRVWNFFDRYGFRNLTRAIEKKRFTGIRASCRWKRSSQPFRGSAGRATCCACLRDAPLSPTRSAHGDSLQSTSQRRRGILAGEKSYAARRLFVCSRSQAFSNN